MRYFEYVANNVDGVVGFEYGENVSHDDERAEYTHCAVISFRSLMAKEMYLICGDYHRLRERLCLAASNIAIAEIDVSG